MSLVAKACALLVSAIVFSLMISAPSQAVPSNSLTNVGLLIVDGSSPQVGDYLDSQQLQTMGIDTSQLQAMISGATPVPSTESYSDTVGGAPDDATTQFDFAEPLAAPPGSYDVLDTWFPAYNGGKIYYRRGYYDGTTGFGDAKIRLKHNLNKRIVKGVTQHPVSKPEFISGHKWNYDGLVILVKCNSLGCWVADARQVKAVVDFRSLGNGTTMGAVNAFCVQTGNWCPDWVKNAIISS